jgi:hypothetical protein
LVRYCSRPCRWPLRKAPPSTKRNASVATAEAKKRPDAEVKAAIAEGGKKAKAAHAFEKKGVTPKQVDALLAYVRELQKK